MVASVHRVARAHGPVRQPRDAAAWTAPPAAGSSEQCRLAGGALHRVLPDRCCAGEEKTRGSDSCPRWSAGFIDLVRSVLFGWAPASCGAAVMFWVLGAAGRPGGGPRRLVPLLAAARMFTTHHRPHNSPHKSAPLGLFRRRSQPGRILAAVAALPIAGSGRYWSRSRRHGGTSRRAPASRTVNGGWPGPHTVGQERLRCGAGQPGRTVGRGCWAWRSLS